jgi:hypothetical protein
MSASYASLFSDVPGPDGEGGTEKRNEHRKRRRKERNGKITELDEVVTAALRAGGSAPSALGARPDGRTPNGRAFHAVLADVIRYLTDVRKREPAASRAALREPRVKEEPTDEEHSAGDICFRDGLLACESVLCFEVEAPSWKICALGRGAERFLQHAPWGPRAEGQILSYLVKAGDEFAFQGMFKQAQAQEAAKSSSSYCFAGGMSELTKIRLLRFHMVRESSARNRNLAVAVQITHPKSLLSLLSRVSSQLPFPGLPMRAPVRLFRDLCGLTRACAVKCTATANHLTPRTISLSHTPHTTHHTHTSRYVQYVGSLPLHARARILCDALSFFGVRRTRVCIVLCRLYVARIAEPC